MSTRREKHDVIGDIEGKAEAQDALRNLYSAFRDQQIDRRQFLLRTTAVLSALTITSIPVKAATTKTSAPRLEKAEWRDDPWWTISEVQEHLLPTSEDSPGAKSIGSAAYLKQELASPRVPDEEKKLLLEGVDWLNDMAITTQKARFSALDHIQREQVLRQIEQSSVGQKWLSLLIYYALEALLTDPIYGGNPDGSGWRWLDHHVGYPRPTEDKVYSKL